MSCPARDSLATQKAHSTSQFARSMAVAAQCGVDPGRFHGLQHAGAAQVSLALVAHSAGEMACPGLAVLDLSAGAQPKAFFCAFVGFLLWHGCPLFRTPRYCVQKGTSALPLPADSWPYALKIPSPTANIDSLLYRKATSVEGGSLRNSSASAKRSLRERLENVQGH